MDLSFAKKAIFFTKKIDFPKIRYQNVQYFNLAQVHKPKFELFAHSKFFFLSLSFPFSWPFYSRYILRFICFLTAIKKLGVNYGQSLEMGPCSITSIMGHFTTIFASKLITLFFNLLCQNAVDIQNSLLCG